MVAQVKRRPSTLIGSVWGRARKVVSCCTPSARYFSPRPASRFYAPRSEALPERRMALQRRPRHRAKTSLRNPARHSLRRRRGPGSCQLAPSRRSPSQLKNELSYMRPQTARCYDRPERLMVRPVLVHNPLAINPLPLGMLGAAVEYEYVLDEHRSSPAPQAPGP